MTHYTQTIIDATQAKEPRTYSWEEVCAWKEPAMFRCVGGNDPFEVIPKCAVLIRGEHHTAIADSLWSKDRFHLLRAEVTITVKGVVG